MSTPRKTERIETMIEPVLKRKYKKFAEQVLGIDLSTWIRGLMKKDFEAYSPKKR